MKKAYSILLLILVFGFGNSCLFAQKLPSGPQVLTFHSEADDTEQPYALYLPPDFDENRSYPFVMMLHGAGSNHRLALKRVFGKSNKPGETDVEASRYFQPWDDVEYIVAAPYARGTAGYRGIPEMDVYAVLDDVKSRFKIDENRTYLTGLSMGGGGTLWIGLTRPDLWAAIAPVCPAPPQGAREMIGNALNLPVRFFHGDADPAVPVQGSRDWVAEMQALGINVEMEEYEGVKHDSWVNAYEGGRIFEWFDQWTRNPYPEKVYLSTRQLKYGKAYWVEAKQIVPGRLATVEAEVAGENKIKVTTENLLAFSLDAGNHPHIGGGEVEVDIDGQTVQAGGKGKWSFIKSGNQWQKGEPAVGGLAKIKGQEGPIFEAFSGRHVYVYGTEDDPGEEEVAKRRAVALEAANWSVYRGEFLGRIMFFPRVISDKEVRPSDLETANLILFGTKETNKWIREWADQLPLHLSSGSDGLGLFYIYPINNRYVVVSSGLPWWGGRQSQGFSFVSQAHGVLPNFKDFVLFNGSTDTVMADGHFDLDWNLIPGDRDKLEKSGRVTLK
ncbi:alpha/beta hydrolase-fold protein [Negadavirga shengliensis]|uniref:Alpha/beta hydrolase-fold protein n=1 Tax=Negadavirga shengliensis TaxID=1389218 RepID=A0ABV9T6Z5_9BACT